MFSLQDLSPSLNPQFDIFDWLDMPRKRRFDRYRIGQDSCSKPSRRPSGTCPRCSGPVFPTGRKIRVPFEMEAGASTREVGIKKRWRYEDEHICKKCKKKWGASQIQR
jgi:hypothetical protein